MQRDLGANVRIFSHMCIVGEGEGIKGCVGELGAINNRNRNIGYLCI